MASYVAKTVRAQFLLNNWMQQLGTFLGRQVFSYACGAGRKLRMPGFVSNNPVFVNDDILEICMTFLPLDLMQFPCT